MGTLLAAGGWEIAYSATPVPAGSELTDILSTATSTDYVFNLQGDVHMESAFTMTGTNYGNIFIDGSYGDGARAVITRDTIESRFNVSTGATELAITNAVITSAVSASGGNGAIFITTRATTLNLDNTTFTGNTVRSSWGYGGALSAVTNTNTVVNGNVSFHNNKGAGDAGGAVGIMGGNEAARSSMTFTGGTSFEGNSTVNYGGAIGVSTFGSVIFENTASFKNNYATASFGGAIDIWGGTSFATFKKDAAFEGNYVKNTTANNSSGVRGGAINIGFMPGVTTVDRPQLDFQGKATFSGNYVWGLNSINGYGGAISIASSSGIPDSSGVLTGNIYVANINQGIFKDNYAYSVNAKAYGGAIYAKSYQTTLTLGSGSSFVGNYAKSLGGAIYFDQGTLNLNGNILFQGNRHGVSFDTTDNKLAYVAGTGTANAIYFGVFNNTATLNLNTAAGERIDFYDPIAAASGKTVAVNKTGDGTVTFYENDSALLATTTVSGGTFKLTSGASYGLLGTTTNSTFAVGAGATLRGGVGSTLNASLFSLDGTLAMDAGTFTINTGGNVTLVSSTVLDIIINSTDSHSLVQVNGGAVGLGGARLLLNVDGAVLHVGDEFKIIESSISVSGLLAEGDSVFAGDYEFDILYNATDVTLRVTAVPEPSTYALLGALGAAGLVTLRRRKK